MILFPLNSLLIFSFFKISFSCLFSLSFVLLSLKKYSLSLLPSHTFLQSFFSPFLLFPDLRQIFSIIFPAPLSLRFLYSLFLSFLFFISPYFTPRNIFFHFFLFSFFSLAKFNSVSYWSRVTFTELGVLF